MTVLSTNERQYAYVRASNGAGSTVVRSDGFIVYAAPDASVYFERGCDVGSDAALINDTTVTADITGAAQLTVPVHVGHRYALRVYTNAPVSINFDGEAATGGIYNGESLGFKWNPSMSVSTLTMRALPSGSVRVTISSCVQDEDSAVENEVLSLAWSLTSSGDNLLPPFIVTAGFDRLQGSVWTAHESQVVVGQSRRLFQAPALSSNAVYRGWLQLCFDGQCSSRHMTPQTLTVRRKQQLSGVEASIGASGLEVMFGVTQAAAAVPAFGRFVVLTDGGAQSSWHTVMLEDGKSLQTATVELDEETEQMLASPGEHHVMVQVFDVNGTRCFYAF